jgi:ABC-type sugar transport system substrate-binding protein
MKTGRSLRALLLAGAAFVTFSLSSQAFAQAKTLAICVPLYAEYFKFVADTVKGAMESQGYKVEIASSDSDTQTMINQIQNFTTRRPELMYVFPAGDAGSFNDVIKKAKDSGIKVVISHNPTSPGTANAIAMADEFIMGVMGAKMVGAWVDATYPKSAAGSVKVLVVESNLIPDMIKRCSGIKIIAEQYLRKVDMKNARYIQGDAGLIKDSAGKAIPNPFYNPKVKIVEISNRAIMTNSDAQAAIDVAFTANNGKDKDIAAVICYSGDAAIGASERLVQMSMDKTLKTPLEKMAVFGADATPTNQGMMKRSQGNAAILRGVMTNGNIIGSVIDLLTKLSKGEKVNEMNLEPLGYQVPNKSFTGFDNTLYNNELPPTEKFF